MSTEKKEERVFFAVDSYTIEDAEAHKRVMEWLRNATPEERRASLVDAGIIDEQGQLTAPYRNEAK